MGKLLSFSMARHIHGSATRSGVVYIAYMRSLATQTKTPARLTAEQWALVQKRSGQTEITIESKSGDGKFHCNYPLNLEGRKLPSMSLHPKMSIKLKIAPGVHSFWFTTTPPYLGSSIVAMAASSGNRQYSNEIKMDFRAGCYFFDCDDCNGSLKVKLVQFENWPELTRAGIA